MPGLSAAPMMAGPNEGIPMAGAQPGGRPLGMTYDVGQVMPIIGKTLMFGRGKFGLGGDQQDQSTAIPVEDDDEEQTMGYAEGGPVEEEEGEVIEEPVAPPVEQAIPEEPEEPPVEQPQGAMPMEPFGGEASGVMEYLRGGDAAPAQTVAAMEHATGVEDPVRAKYAALAEAYDQGGPEQAWRLMQSYRQQDMLQRTLAATKLQRGDAAGAAEAATQAMQNVLDGQNVQFVPTPDGSGMMVATSDLTGQGQDTRLTVPIKKFFDWLTGPSGQHDALLSAGGVRQSLGGAGGEAARDQEQANPSTPGSRLSDSLGQMGRDISNSPVARGIRAVRGYFGGDDAGIPDGSPRGGAGGEAARNVQQGIPEYQPPNEDWKKPGYVSPYDQSLFDRDVQTREEIQRRRRERIDRENEARQTPEERLFGREIVAAANRLFPYQRQEQQRAAFLTKQLELRQANEGKERVAGVNAEGKQNVARTNADQRLTSNERTVQGRLQTANTRAQSAAEVQRMRGETSERQHSATDISRIAAGLIANNPRLAKDPNALAEAVNQYLEGRGGQAAPAPRQAASQGAPQGGQQPPVPGAKLYKGQWYTRGPNGESVPVQ